MKKKNCESKQKENFKVADTLSVKEKLKETFKHTRWMGKKNISNLGESY